MCVTSLRGLRKGAVMKLPLGRYLALLKTYLKPQWRSTLLLGICLVTGIGLQLLNPQILRYFIDAAGRAPKEGASMSLVIAGLFSIAVALLNRGVPIATTYFSEYVAWTATNALRSDLVALCLSRDMGSHKARTAGELIERIDGDVDALSNFFSQFAVSLLSNMLLLLGVLVLFFYIDWRVGVTMTAFSAVAFLIMLYLRQRAIPFWKEQRQMSALFYVFLSERLGGTEDILANGATASILPRFYMLLRQWFPVFKRAIFAAADMGITTDLIFVCGSALALMLGAYLWSIKLITVGTVYLMFRYTDMLSQPLNEIQTQFQDLQQAEPCIQRVEELLHAKPALQDDGRTPLPRRTLAAAFRDVLFA